MSLADTDTLLRFLLDNDLAGPAIGQAVRTLKIRREDFVSGSKSLRCSMSEVKNQAARQRAQATR
jgi:hypothetical protein